MLRWIVFVLVLALAGIAVAACGALPGVAADASLQGPVVPTRALPSPTPTDEPATLTPTPEPTATSSPTATPTDTPEATTEPTTTTEPTATTQPTITPTPWLVAGQAVTHPITIGSTQRDTITSQQPMVVYGFRASGGETVDISMTRNSGNLDPFLIVIDSGGREVARNDDVNPADTGAAIRGLTLAEAGDYLIVASRYGQRFGESVGDFTMALSTHDEDATPSGTIAVPMAYGELRDGTISNSRNEHIFTFAASAGDLVSMQASATSGNLDTSLTLTDHLGNPITRNDDDITNTSTDAALRNVLIPADGYYSIVVGRYQGPSGVSAGDFRLKLTLDESDADEGGRLRYAIINPLASGTIREDGSVYTDYFVGDRVDEENEERRYQALLTFALPERPEGADVEEAAFIPQGCSMRGSGMSTGPLVIYADRFVEVVGSRQLADIGENARELGRLRECEPLDVSNAVRAAYARGDDFFQMRLVLPDAPQNRETDAVGLSEPRLSVRFDVPAAG